MGVLNYSIKYKVVVFTAIEAANSLKQKKMCLTLKTNEDGRKMVNILHIVHLDVLCQKSGKDPCSLQETGTVKKGELSLYFSLL